MTALSVAMAPIACSDAFTSCEDTQTCETSEGGEGGEGAGGSSAGRDAGEGGSAGDTTGAALEVLEVTPEDGAVDVDRIPTIRIRFSEPLDPASVTAESVVLEGPEGVIDVELSVDGPEVTLVPSGALSLLGHHGVYVSTTVASEAGATLLQNLQVQFRIRDGLWGAAQRLDTSLQLLRVQKSGAGHMLAAWTGASGLAKAAVFEPAMHAWTSPHVLDIVEGNLVDWTASINDAGEAVVGWHFLPGETSGWARFDAANGWTPTVADTINREIAVGNDGTVLSTWTDYSNTGDLFYSLLAEEDMTWGPPRVLYEDANGGELVPTSSGIFLSHGMAGRAGYWGSTFEAGNWSSPVALTGDSSVGVLVIRTSAKGTVLVAWTSNQEGAWVAEVAEGVVSPIQLETRRPTSYADFVMNAADEGAAAWITQPAAYASVRSSDGSWSAPEGMGPVSQQNAIAPSPGIDGQGNVVLVWAANDQLLFRRWIVDEGWQSLVTLPLGGAAQAHVVTSPSGDSALLWYNDSGLWTALFE